MRIGDGHFLRDNPIYGFNENVLLREEIKCQNCSSLKILKFARTQIYIFSLCTPWSIHLLQKTCKKWYRTVPLSWDKLRHVQIYLAGLEITHHAGETAPTQSQEQTSSDYFSSTSQMHGSHFENSHA